MLNAFSSQRYHRLRFALDTTLEIDDLGNIWEAYLKLYPLQSSFDSISRDEWMMRALDKYQDSDVLPALLVEQTNLSQQG